MNKHQVYGQLRGIGMAIAGLLVHRGRIEQSEVELVVAIVIGLGMLIWSWNEKRGLVIGTTEHKDTAAKIAKAGLILVLLLGLLAGLTGCASMGGVDAGPNTVAIAKAKYQQDTTFIAYEMSGVNRIEGTNIHIVARSYRPPISIIPEPSIMDKLCDAAKWVAGFYFGSEMLKSVSEKSVVNPEVVHADVVTVPATP